jgi:hypothetical protein
MFNMPFSSLDLFLAGEKQTWKDIALPLKDQREKVLGRLRAGEEGGVGTGFIEGWQGSACYIWKQRCTMGEVGCLIPMALPRGSQQDLKGEEHVDQTLREGPRLGRVWIKLVLCPTFTCVA